MTDEERSALLAANHEGMPNLTWLLEENRDLDRPTVVAIINAAREDLIRHGECSIGVARDLIDPLLAATRRAG